ncbi:hypothetical protein P4114_23925 [Pseudomonas aeruginosa]|nr:hypothetical protein [Pseudomonas aeruginosa]
MAQQLAPEDTSYNLLAHLRIVGATADAIELALRQLLERHVALRRRVETGVDGPQPHALAAHVVPLQRLLASDAVHAERLLEDGVRREGARVFDLAHEAPARLLLVVTRDWRARRPPAQRPSLRLRRCVAGGLCRGTEDAARWRSPGRARQHAGTGLPPASARRWPRDAWTASPSAGLSVCCRWRRPGAAPARPEESGRRAGQRLALPVSAAVHAACRALAERTSVSPFSAALQAFAEVLGAELGVDDLLVGVALAGRSRLEMQGAGRLLRQPPAAGGRPASGAVRGVAPAPGRP